MSIAGKPESSRNEEELVNWTVADQGLLAAAWLRRRLNVWRGSKMQYVWRMRAER